MKRVNPIYIFLAAAIAVAFHGSTLSAREISIATPAELNLLATALPGDVVLLKNGNWTDAHITVTKGGSAESPLVIRAETPGEVILNGTSNIKINAPYVTVDGLYFRKGAQGGGTVINFNSNNGIVRNTALIDALPLNLDTKSYCVFFAGENNLVDRCYIKGKSNYDPVVGNSREGSRHNAVKASYFKDIPYAPKNGREIFRVWGYGGNEDLGDDGAFFTIEGNLFDHADGEGAEIISLKSNRNLVVRNTIVATRGGINIRSGNFNTIQDNIILGKGVAESAGIRMSGQNHVVKGNFVSGCDEGIQISCGDCFEKDLTGKYVPCLRQSTPLGRVPYYGAVKNLTLSGNTVIGTKGADLDIGAKYKIRWPKQQSILLPEGCLIENNRLVRAKGGVAVTGTVPGADKDPALPKAACQPNKYVGNVILGGKNSFAPSKAGFVEENLPAGWSETAEAAKFKPLTPADVGPDWVRSKAL